MSGLSSRDNQAIQSAFERMVEKEHDKDENEDKDGKGK